MLAIFKVLTQVSLDPAPNIKLLEQLAQGASRFEKLLPPPTKIHWPPIFSNDVSQPGLLLAMPVYGPTSDQVLHYTNNVTDSSCHCVSADHSSGVVGSVASSSELLLT